MISSCVRLKSEEYKKDQVIEGKWRGDRFAAKENVHGPESDMACLICHDLLDIVMKS